MAENVLAICGKGGVGKTAISALIARALIARGRKPLLMIDADPAGGLVQAMGESSACTLMSARDDIVRAARTANGELEKTQLADQLDYFVMEALHEREGFAFLAMGRNKGKGCFCPANTLLRSAIDALAEPFLDVLIDAEAGLEQISREVTRRVTLHLVVVDGSGRSMKTLETISGMLGEKRIAVISNRAIRDLSDRLPGGVEYLGAVPEDAELREYDTDGRPLWDLPEGNPATLAVSEIVRNMVL